MQVISQQLQQVEHGILALDNPYIGRAEPEVFQILSEIYPDTLIIPQHPIQKLIPYSWYNGLSQENKQHKFDFVVFTKTLLVVEVNFKHKEKAAIKWRRIFAPMIEELTNPKAIPVPIKDYESLTLFKHTKTNHKPLIKQDYQDVLMALKMAGVCVNFVIPKCN